MSPSKSDDEARTNDFIAKCIAILTICLGLWGLWSDYSFIRSASKTTGTLTSEPTVRQRRIAVDYYVDYIFTVEGQTYSGHHIVHDDPSHGLTVYYERANPNNNRGEYPEVWNSWLLLIIGVILLIAIVNRKRWFQTGLDA